MKDEGCQTNRRKMQDKGSMAALFEQYKYPDTEPDQSNYRKENDPGCPPRDTVYVL